MSPDILLTMWNRRSERPWLVRCIVENRRGSREAEGNASWDSQYYQRDGVKKRDGSPFA